MRKVLAMIIPPAAVARYGCASCTAAPIGVFWLTSLVGIGYSLMGGTLGGWPASRWIIIGLSITLWVIAAVWARLVIHGVNEDLDESRQGSLDRRVVPQPDEADPFKEIGKAHGNLHL
jgi:type VI protein secretion system component VasK